MIPLVNFQDYIREAPAASFIFVITIATSVYSFLYDQSIIDKFILHPWSIVRERQHYRILTSALLHANWTHLLVNMVTFYFFVFQLETSIGHWQFVAVYVGSLIISTISPIMRNKDRPEYYALGASGAIAGALFSMIIYMLVYYPSAQILLFFIIPIPTWLFPILYIGYSYWADKRGKDNIGHDAHLWGAIGGFFLTLILDPDAAVALWYYLGSRIDLLSETLSIISI